MAKPSFEQNVHICRGVAILLIVSAHTIQSFDWTGNEMIARIIDAFCNQASAIFFFIAGYLFQALSYNFDTKKYYISKVKNVLLPYLIVSLPALYIYTHIIQRPDMYAGFYDTSFIYQVFFFLITGKHLAPLWFVPTITLFYVVGPLLLKLDRYKAFYFIIPPLLAIALYLGRDGSLGPINKAIYLVPAYLFGMAFSHYRDYWYKLFTKYWLLFAAASVACYVAIILDYGNPPYLQVGFKMMLAGLFLIGLKKYGYLIGSRLDYIAHISFGIFFVHGYFIGAMRMIYGYANSGVLTMDNSSLLQGNVLVYLVYTAVVVALSVFSIWIVQLAIGHRSRMVVGA